MRHKFTVIIESNNDTEDKKMLRIAYKTGLK